MFKMRRITRLGIVGASVLALAAGPATAAFASGPNSPGSEPASVTIPASITMGLTGGPIALSGNVGDTVQLPYSQDITSVITTNDGSGYVLTINGTGDLAGPGSHYIPLGNLE